MSEKDQMKLAKEKAKTIVDAAKAKAKVSIDAAKAKAAIMIEKAKAKAKKVLDDAKEKSKKAKAKKQKSGDPYAYNPADHYDYNNNKNTSDI